MPAPLPPAAPASAAAPGARDPYGSLIWPDLRREYLGNGPVVFDPRVRVDVPAFAEDPMNVPVTVSADGIEGIERITVIVDRNPIRKVLEYMPLTTLPRVSFRFKLQQASPVRAAVLTRDGVWHVGGGYVDSAGGGCTTPGDSRRNGSWAQSLGQVSARLFPHSVAPGAPEDETRLRLRVMHPMDTGLAGGIPAFYINHLSLRDAAGHELMRLNAYEPVSENPIFSFDFAGRVQGKLELVGTDNDGNRIAGEVR
ncbi:MAG: quinoprotein dehydrogenase-associated SoxYZ-like carrier [Burkholderiales bacterium]|nr:quinoprotein dehydrogenase-associated SoxYZ-like carrier [Burkholderiales bacterium]MDE1928821.1 quinoprotein dehydrogenase-associated SoxYZ-like carrier [Burkholderiales bacterium]MDE2159210.1 quinoprotein dehydrogenase-associated SoxYZ-like carrier [Burkholderiales bacterium]MDE2503099.1 quinoprotein dehydrogenase-associated SoxYZ-like carrier [Burkholderiales bacterium]